MIAPALYYTAWQLHKKMKGGIIMKLHKCKIIAVIVIAVILVSMFTGCSEYGKNEKPKDSHTNSQAGDNSIPDNNPGDPNKGMPKNEIPDSPPALISEDNAYSIGDEVVMSMPIDRTQFGDMKFCLKKAELITELAQIGIDKVYDYDKGALNPDGKLKNNYAFILVVIDVTNISCASDYDDNAAYLGLKSGVSAKNPNPNFSYEMAYRPSEFTYFINSEYAFGSGSYFHYKLAIGETKEIQIGWIVDLEEFDKSKLFLSIGEGGEEALKKYVNLGL